MTIKIKPLLLVDLENGTWAIYQQNRDGWQVWIGGLRPLFLA